MRPLSTAFLLAAIVRQLPDDPQLASPVLAYIINSGKTDMESVDFLARQEKPEAGGKIVGTTATMLRAQVKADMLGRGLERLFGPVPPAVLELMAEASEEALDAWFDKALEAKSLEEVFDGAGR